MGIVNIRIVGSSGKGIKARYSGKASGNLGGMVNGGYSDSNGHAVLEWSGTGYLETIYIDGNANNGKFTSGNTYVFNK